MIDFSGMIEFWSKMIAAQVPDAQAELFSDKLSRIGVKAPFATPPAFEQLGKAVAMAQEGSGNFMGDPLNDNGINSNVVRAEIMVKENLGFHQASKIMNAYYKGVPTG